MPPVIIDLGSNNATFTGGSADYLITGANGNDTVTLGDGTDQLALGTGNNTLTLGGGTDQVTAGLGNNTVTTGSGADSITLTDGNNTVSVGGGNDVIRAGDGANVVTTGDGNSSVTLGAGFDQVTTGNGNSTVVVGDSAGDTVIVGVGSNTIALGIGAADVVHTGSGGNTVSVSAAVVGADSILGGLTTSDGSNNALVLTTAGTVNVAGVSGFQTFQLADGGPNAITLSDANFTRLPGGSITVLGGDGGNAVDASALSAADSASIHAGLGDNVLTGGAGNDFFFGSPGTSVVDGGAGFNTMTFAGPMSDYAISTVGGVTHVVGDGESDSLVNIQQLVFGPVPCFTPGTLIDVPGGQAPVEQLRSGDQVVLARGGVASIIWIGRRSFGGRFLAGRDELLPILIRAGALGDGLPRRDLRISPLHAMFLDGVLVPAEHLVNGVTIVRDVSCRQVEYIHVELEQHDIISAEGAPSETFLDDDNRGMFHNAHEHAALHPAVRSPGEYCAPRVESGYALQAIRQRLADIARQTAVAA